MRPLPKIDAFPPQFSCTVKKFSASWPRPPLVDGLKISGVVLRIDGRLINGRARRLNRLIALKVGVAVPGHGLVWELMAG